MKFNNNIPIEQRILFTKSVSDMSKINGVYEPALYDFAFRASFLLFFTDMDIGDGSDLEQINKIAFSEEVNEALETPGPRKYVLMGLNNACKEKIRQENEKYMIAYTEAVKDDPWSRIADALEKFAEDYNAEKLVAAILNASNENAIISDVAGDVADEDSGDAQ